MSRLLIFLLSASCWAGQSIQVATQTVSAALANRDTAWRAEFYLHDWAASPTTTSRVIDAEGLGLAGYFNGSNLLIYNTRESGASDQCQIPLTGLAERAMYVRYQHNPDTNTDYCEAWDRTGERFFSLTITYTSKSGSGTGFQIGGTFGENRSFAFARAHSTLVGLNARMPVTADNADALIHWKFEGDLTDASGNGLTGSLSSGTATYVSTPYQITGAVIRTSDAPSWTNWISMRAGHSNTLDGDNSFSQIDSSATVTCMWNLLSGPSTPKWSSRTSCNPSITGLVFGDYEFQLTVTDGDGTTATTTQHIGSVAYDSNGIVIQENAEADVIFGPMIAFGQSPWGYMDERHLQMVSGQETYYDTNWPASQPWMSNGAGTVAYEMRPSNKTTLNGAITSTATSITVASAAALDLATFPTRILIGAYNGSYEWVRICSAAGNTLTVCFDGRGAAAQSTGGTNPGAAAWSDGASVQQPKLTGTGTTFLTDSKALCPAGAPGPAGAVTYSTGTVTLSAGSTTVTGSGTTWTSSHVGTYIRVGATHSGGTVFVFSAVVTAFTDATHLTVSRAAPTGVDGSAFSYSLISRRFAVPSYAAPDNSSQLIYHDAIGCESETAAFTQPYLEMGEITNSQSGRTYTYMDSYGIAQHPTVGVNYYGSGLALRAFYLRSGLASAHTLANRMDDWWIRHPEVSGGWAPSNFPGPGRMGGVIGAIANIVLNDDALIDWTNIRGQIDWALGRAQLSSSTCDGADTRDSATAEMQVILAALYDVDPAGDAQSRRDTARTALSAAQGVNAKINSCRTQGRTALAAETNSWATGFYFSELFGDPDTALSATNGSDTVTGSGIPSSICHGIASGTVSVTNGSAAFTGTGLVNGSKIVITGTKTGVGSWTRFMQFTQSGGTSGTLSALWDGDTGSATYIIEDTTDVLTLAANAADNQAAKNWSCTWVSSTEITLHKPWDGSTGTVYAKWNNISGYAQQAFMLGMKAYALRLGQVAEERLSLATDFESNAALAANWIKDYGVETDTKGVHYGRIMGACEPLASPGNAAFDTVLVDEDSCGNNSLNSSSIQLARVQLGEMSNAFRVLYEDSPITATQDWIDAEFGALWGKSSMTEAGYDTDANYVQFELSDSSLASYKWPGFFFGMGMAHQWPAVRQGAVAAAIPVTITRGMKLTGGQKMRLTLTKPDGSTVTSSICASSPCTVTGDRRQGDHLMVVERLNSSDQVIATGQSQRVRLQ